MGNATVKQRARVFSHEFQILRRTCQCVNSPRALTVYLLARSGEWSQLFDLETDPSNYEEPASFADDYLVTEMLKKSKSIPYDVDRTAVAFSRWLESEKECHKSNEVIELFSRGEYCTHPTTAQIINLAVGICHRKLGRLTVNTLKRVADSADFGPGATLSVGGCITRGRKFSNPELTTTQELLGFGLFFLPPPWRSLVTGFKIENANRLEFVPKNVKTDRAITIEADLNIYVQKGIGSVLRDRLANSGVRLEDRPERHHHLAKISAECGLSTIDLQSASDTICYELVRFFLPEDWFALLQMCRPEYSTYKDVTYRLGKFSGMGNGYTFELETLIFESLVEAAARVVGSKDPTSVFGDDIICSNAVHVQLVPALKFLGFKVNERKTFGKGRFHESCGADYFDRVNVRPFYLKWGRYDQEEELCLYQYGNLLRSYAHRRNGGLGCDSRFLPAWLYCLKKVSPTHRHFVPSWDFMDGGFVGNLDEAAPSCLRRPLGCGWSGFSFKYRSRSAVSTTRFACGAYVSALRNTGDFTKGREAVRNRSQRAKTRWTYCLSWSNLGPWV